MPMTDGIATAAKATRRTMFEATDYAVTRPKRRSRPW
jgi:hypothetical protein